MLWSTYQSSCSYSLRHWQMFSLTGSKLLQWYYLAGMVFLCMCVHTEVSKGQLAGCGLQRWLWLGGSGGETAGVAAISSQVLPLTSTPQLSSPPTSLSPFCLHSVRGRDGICYGERLTALMHISLNATLPAVTIRKEHMLKLGTTSEELLHSQCSPFFTLYSTHGRCAFEVIVTVIWTELKYGSVWLILMHLRWIPLPG